MHTIAQDISRLAEHLPTPAQAELLDFAQFLLAKYRRGGFPQIAPNAHLLRVGQQLAELGGTQPQLESIRRRREVPE